MNALSLAVYLDARDDVAAALETWERNERPMTEHTQRISYFLGLPTTWPPALRAFTLRHGGPLEMAHRATHAHGAAPADGDVNDCTDFHPNRIARKIKTES